MEIPAREIQVELLATDPARFWPVSAWMSSIDVDEAAALLELVQTSSTSLRVRAAYQLCQFDPSDPGLASNLRDWARLGTALVDTAGTRVFTGFQDLTTPTQNTKNNFWIRFGLDLQRATGSAPERAIVRFTGYTRY
jgi:hypothetical protein